MNERQVKDMASVVHDYLREVLAPMTERQKDAERTIQRLEIKMANLEGRVDRHEQAQGG